MKDKRQNFYKVEMAHSRLKKGKVSKRQVMQGKCVSETNIVLKYDAKSLEQDYSSSWSIEE